MTRLALACAAFALLPACSDGDEPQPIDGITQSEAEALDDAAAIIDERQMPEGVFGEDTEQDAQNATGETSE